MGWFRGSLLLWAPGAACPQTRSGLELTGLPGDFTNVLDGVPQSPDGGCVGIYGLPGRMVLLFPFGVWKDTTGNSGTYSIKCPSAL